MGLPGTSVLAAAATYAGLQVRGTLRELRARLQPWETAAALEQEAALDAAGMDLVPRMLDVMSRARVAEETVRLARRTMTRFGEAAPVSGTLQADLRDDELLGHQEAAQLILGLQDRTTRDHAAEWMEAEEAGPALRLWRALARRCVGPYGEHAAAPLTLAGWVAWSAGDEIEAREALAMALGADPSYLFARLLHQACNEGLDPESIRRCLRAEREGRDVLVRAESAQSGDMMRTDAPASPTTPRSGGSQAAFSPDSDGIPPALPSCADGAPPPCPAETDGAVPAPRLGSDEILPAPPSATSARRRKRVRPSVRTEACSNPADGEGRASGAEETRRRSRPVGSTRPGAVRRRAAGQADARGPEGARPGVGATEEEG